MDKHVLSCEQVYSGGRIIIQEWFDERETKQGHKEGDLDHIIKFTVRCIPLYYRHIPTTQGLSKHIPYLIFPCTENSLFLWLLVGPFIDATCTTISLLQCNHLDGWFLSAINICLEVSLNAIIVHRSFIGKFETVIFTFKFFDKPLVTLRDSAEGISASLPL